MNTSGLLQSYFARDPKYSWFHEPSKNWIHFLKNSKAVRWTLLIKSQYTFQQTMPTLILS